MEKNETCSENEMSSTKSEMDNEKNTSLTEAQLARIERNKQKALQLRQARISNLQKPSDVISQKEVNVSLCPRDTGAGFLLDEENIPSNNKEKTFVSTPAPLVLEDRPVCMSCSAEFSDSFLYHHYDHKVCDTCRDADGEHCLISKTDAKKEYLLKDCDFDKREPPLKFILRKNPHNVHGNMKLYLRLQVEKRAFDVFGNEEGLDEAKEERVTASEKRKKKAYDKRLKTLRMSVRSSLYREATHEHVYGEEVYDIVEDVFEKTCTTCGYQLKFEKM